MGIILKNWLDPFKENFSDEVNINVGFKPLKNGCKNMIPEVL